MEKFVEIEEDYLLLVKGEIIGEDQDIIFYDVTSPDNNFLKELMLFRCNLGSLGDFRQPTGHFHIFNLRDYLQDMWISFKQSEVNVVKQLELDYHRQDYFLNNVRCPTLSEYFIFLNKLQGMVIENHSVCKGRWLLTKENTLYKPQINILQQYIDILVMMLSTQAPFAYIVEVMQRCHPQLQVIQSSSKSNKYDGRPQIRAHFVETHDKISQLRMELNISRDVFDMETETLVKKLYCCLHINFDKSAKFPEEPLGVISWISSFLPG